MRLIGRGDKEGVAALEFALFLPLFFLIFFALIEGAKLLSAARKVSLATNMLAELASQEKALAYADIDGLVSAIENMIGGEEGSAYIRISSILRNEKGKLGVDWSRDSKKNMNVNSRTVLSLVPQSIHSSEDIKSVLVTTISYSHKIDLFGSLYPQLEVFRSTIKSPRTVDNIEICQKKCAVD